ncbi:Rpn family recombination-promoting nuclease/putative transposase [Intestinibacter sp.]|uniref:Rpn family recombination-promoting nuclease/putative transposase n=2 Tax=Bacteria TaxID=2 RepID=UPI002A765AAE|nr:Rpn family recombination-promoting nuclease/putative transposase [Intestinibacter sp.]MDY2734633.1 Rpn family recombination-promoting nuclease/putative transposase [Intestinibacter sp.]
MKIKYTKEEIEIAKSLRPINDALFRTMAKDNIPLVEHIIRVTLNRDDISIIRINTQDDIHLFSSSHSIILDCLGVDSNGVLYDIEVQTVDNDDLEKRARYISSMIDVKYALEKNQAYGNLKQSIVIFLMEKDIFGLGKQLYEFIRKEKEINLPLKDGNNIIYVNAENKGREDLNNLMQSLISYDLSEMKDEVIKECAMYYKTTQKGEDKVCEAIREYAAKSYDEGKDDGIKIGKEDGIKIGKADGINEGTVKTLINLLNSGNITTSCAIANSGLSKEEFMSIAKKLGLSY